MGPIHKLSRPGIRSIALGIVAVFGIGVAVGYWLGLTKGMVKGNNEMTDSTTKGPFVPPPLESSAWLERRGKSGVDNSSNAQGVAITADLRDAYRAVVKIYDSRARQKALQQLVEALPVERWPELFDAIEKLNKAQEFEDSPEETARHIGLTEELLAVMAATSPEAGLRALRQHAAPHTNAALDGIVRNWAAQDLQAALDFYEKCRISDQNALSIGTTGALAGEYIKRDPHKAFEWIASLSAEHRPEATRVAFQILSRVDPSAALQFFASEVDVPNRGLIANHIAAGWTKSDPEAAFAWATQLSPEIRDTALEASIDVWARADYQAACVAVRDLEPSIRSVAILELGSLMRPERLEPMADLLINEPHSENQEGLLKHVASSYQLYKPEEGSAWLAELPQGKMRDIAIQGFIKDLDKSDPEAAVAWAAVITDIESRNSSLQDKVGKWLKKDPDAAREWIQSSEHLNEADRSHLLLKAGN
jgi:hypothetical protein